MDIKTQEKPQTQESPQTQEKPEYAQPSLESILGTFPGIWYLAPLDNSIIICASDNYHNRFIGEWYALPSATVEGGLVIHWMIPCPAESFPGVWYVTDRNGAVISHSRNYKDLEAGLWYRWEAPRPNGETMHWALRFV